MIRKVAAVAAATLLAAGMGLTAGIGLTACTGGSTSATEAVTTTQLLPSTTTTSRPLPTTTITTTTLAVVADYPSADPEPPSPGQLTPDGTVGVAIVAAGGALLTENPSGDALVRAHQGLVMAVEGREGDWLRLLTPCDTVAWVNAAEVQFIPRNTNDADSIADAVVVLDPGHGGPNRGATGPSGLAEPEVNLDIARRARDLFSSSHDVDWSTGRITNGDTFQPAANVWLTRTEGPTGGDYEVGLLFRARFATAAGADVLVSIHNNADPDGPFDGPGSEAYYSIHDLESRRLAGLIVEEFRRGFSEFGIEWVGDTDAGAKYRLNSAGDDYYGVVRYSEVPVVITEGAFISHPSEEELLRTPEFRQAYANAVYRAVVRFVTTEDPGSGFTEPYERTIPSGSGAPLPTCEIPSQPEN